MGCGYSCEVRPVCIGVVFDGDRPGQIHLSDPSMQWVFLFLMTWGDMILGCHTGHLVYAVIRRYVSDPILPVWQFHAANGIGPST